jgi:nitroreductase
MTFLELVKARYSCRGYQDRAVEDVALAAVLEAFRLAPSAVNRQPFRLLVLRSEGRRDELLRLYNKPWFAQAPLCLALVLVPAEAWRRRGDGRCFVDVDAAIAFDHLTLAAAEQGLGTCWVAAFDPQAAREVLGLPDGVEPLAFSPLGYPADTPPAKKRRALDDLVRWDRW